MGVDLRQVGSGNIGAANTLRTLGFFPAFLTFSFDFIKGFFPVYFSRAFPMDVRSLVCLAGVLGHDFSPFLKFKGGKGVATSFGGIFALDWKIGVIVLLSWVVVFAIFRIPSIASLSSLGISPIVSIFLGGGFFLVTLILFGLCLIRHRKNIEKLKSGEEKPIRLPGRGQDRDGI